MKLCVVALGLLAAFSGLAQDTVFVRTDTQGVYRAESGRLSEVTPDIVVLHTASGDLLYTRDAVRRVVLATDQRNGDPADRIHRWKRLVARYWNSDTPPLVKAVQSLPLPGEPLRVLDQIPSQVASILATLTLCAAFVWILQKGYEINQNRRLDRLRLKLEIAKLRNETIDLSRKLHLSDESIWQKVEIPLPDLQGDIFKVAADGDLCPWYLRPFISAASRSEQRKLYDAEADVRVRQGTRSMRWALVSRVSLFLAGSLLCFIYGLLVFVGAVRLLFTETFSALLMAAVGLFLLRQSIRLVLKAPDLRKAYHQAQERLVAGKNNPPTPAADPA